MKFLVFPASHRPESYNRKLAIHAAHHVNQHHNVEIDFAEYGEFDMPVYNDTHSMPESAYSFANRVSAANAIIISSPEYNWSYPGSLKNIIDWTSAIKPNPIKGKTVMLLSASPGSRGGILGMDHLKTPLEAMQLHVFHRMFPLGHCQQAFEGEALVERHANALNPMLDAFVTFTQKLSN